MGRAEGAEAGLRLSASISVADFLPGIDPLRSAGGGRGCLFACARPPALDGRVLAPAFFRRSARLPKRRSPANGPKQGNRGAPRGQARRRTHDLNWAARLARAAVKKRVFLKKSHLFPKIVYYGPRRFKSVTHIGQATLEKALKFYNLSILFFAWRAARSQSWPGFGRFLLSQPYFSRHANP